MGIQIDIPGIPSILQPPKQLMGAWDVIVNYLHHMMTPEAWPHKI
jgi:hypothetical protein